MLFGKVLSSDLPHQSQVDVECTELQFYEAPEGAFVQLSSAVAICCLAGSGHK